VPKFVCSFALLAGTILAGCAAEPPGPGNNWGVTSSDPTSVQRGIDAAYHAGASKIVIQPGRYVIDRSDNPGPILSFSGMKNFEIDARDVTLVFPDIFKIDIMFEACDNVKLVGATITRGAIVNSQGTVTAIAPDRKSIDIRIHAGYPTNILDARYFGDAKVLTFYYPNTRQIVAGANDVYYATPTQLGGDLFRFPLAVPQALPDASPIAVGQYVAWRGTAAGRQDIDIGECAHMRIEKVVMLGGTGFVVFEHGGDGDNYYQYDVTYPPAPPGATIAPLLSSNADAFHSTDVRKGPTLENCHFEGMNDDGIPIHGDYSLAMEASGNTVVVNVPHAGETYRPGDRLMFYGLDESREAEATVVNFETLNNYPPRFPATSGTFSNYAGTPLNYRRVTLDHPVAARFGWMVADRDLCGSGFVVRNCTIRNNRGRGIVIKASDGLIEGCTTEGTEMGGIVLSPEMSQCNEGDYAQNVVVKNNTIRHCGLGMQNWWEGVPLSVSARQGDHFVAPPGIANILIEDNKLIDNPGCNMIITSASGVTVKDNVFVWPMTEWWGQPVEEVGDEGIDAGALINTALVDGLSFSGNRVLSPGKFMRTLEAVGTGLVQTGMPGGIVIEK
jgi:parallel beta-helix repeat protein